MRRKKSIVKTLIDLSNAAGGKIEKISSPLSDGSGFAIMSMPLPKNHWLLKEGFNIPPMPLRLGVGHPLREPIREMLKEAGRYAVRCATMNGKEMDFDPDALIQCLVVGFLGYHTQSGLSEDTWANPKK